MFLSKPHYTALEFIKKFRTELLIILLALIGGVFPSAVAIFVNEAIKYYSNKTEKKIKNDENWRSIGGEYIYMPLVKIFISSLPVTLISDLIRYLVSLAFRRPNLQFVSIYLLAVLVIVLLVSSFRNYLDDLLLFINKKPIKRNKFNFYLSGIAYLLLITYIVISIIMLIG